MIEEHHIYKCVFCCNILIFLKNNMWSHFQDQYVVFMQNGINVGPVVLALTKSVSEPEREPLRASHLCIVGLTLVSIVLAFCHSREVYTLLNMLVTDITF